MKLFTKLIFVIIASTITIQPIFSDPITLQCISTQAANKCNHIIQDTTANSNHLLHRSTCPQCNTQINPNWLYSHRQQRLKNFLAQPRFMNLFDADNIDRQIKSICDNIELRLAIQHYVFAIHAEPHHVKPYTFIENNYDPDKNLVVSVQFPCIIKHMFVKKNEPFWLECDGKQVRAMFTDNGVTVLENQTIIKTADSFDFILSSCTLF